MIIPRQIQQFKSEETNQFAAEVYASFVERYGVGRAMSLTWSRLNSSGLNLAKKESQAPVVQKTPEPKPQAPQQPSLFSQDEIKYAGSHDGRPPILDSLKTKVTNPRPFTSIPGVWWQTRYEYTGSKIGIEAFGHPVDFIRVGYDARLSSEPPAEGSVFPLMVTIIVRFGTIMGLDYPGQPIDVNLLVDATWPGRYFDEGLEAIKDQLSRMVEEQVKETLRKDNWKAFFREQVGDDWMDVPDELAEILTEKPSPKQSSLRSPLLKKAEGRTEVFDIGVHLNSEEFGGNRWATGIGTLPKVLGLYEVSNIRVTECLLPDTEFLRPGEALGFSASFQLGLTIGPFRSLPVVEVPFKTKTVEGVYWDEMLPRVTNPKRVDWKLFIPAAELALLDWLKDPNQDDYRLSPLKRHLYTTEEGLDLLDQADPRLIALFKDVPISDEYDDGIPF